MRKTFIAAVLLCLSALCARAQFYTNGSDPSNIRWYSTETPYYKLIYPEGADSLARVYGTLLEQFRVPMGHSIGQTPGDLPKGKKMPVILHTHNPYSNGSVAWAPWRMDLYTVPEAYGSDPTPWEIQLAAHEPRHQAQLQLGYEGIFKLGTWLIGEGFNPLVWALYLTSPLGEGDAVVAETGLASGTRARTADFLNYYRVAYDSGDWRTLNRWRFGSFKYYTPDHYTIGYMTVAGARVFGGDAMVTRTAIDLSLKKPWIFAPDNFRAGKNYRQYAEKFNAIWQEELEERAPFMEGERISAKEKFPVFYSTPVSMGGALYMIRSGYTRSPELVSLKDGVWKTIAPYSSHGSSLFTDEAHNRLYWTETVPDKRWELEGKSIIRYYDVKKDGIFDLTSHGRLYNPTPAPDGLSLSAVEYPLEGGSGLVIIGATFGEEIARYPAPAGVQVTESTWFDGNLYAMCVEEGGYSIRKVGGAWDVVYGPVKAKIVNLGSGDDCFEFVSDASGVNELHRFYPGTGRMVQVSSTRHGSTDFAFDGEYAYYVSETLDGKALMRTPVSALPCREVSATAVHTYKVEDALTAQENAMGGVDRTMQVEFTPAKRYSKLLHPLRFHTWAPVYVNYDAVKNGSFDLSYDVVSLGATAFFQNDLGTLSGALGYGLHKDPDNKQSWRNALHAKLAYTGLYPVFEASLDVGDKAASLYRLAELNAFGNTSTSAFRGLNDFPFVSASLKTYVPLRFSKGGILYGITPQVRYSLSNNYFSSARIVMEAPGMVFKGLPAHYVFSRFKEGDTRMMQGLSASLRGYVMLPSTHSRIYPKWGVGAEIGGYLRPGRTDVFAPATYGYAYGYLPGLYQTHGLKLTALWQQQMFGPGHVIGDIVADPTPRGFDSAVTNMFSDGSNPTQWKITADYAIPFTIGGDLSLMPVAYIRNFILTPHIDYTGLADGNLWSVGADFAADMGYVVITSVNATVGLSFSFLGGTWYGYTGQSRNWYLGPVFEMSF